MREPHVNDNDFASCVNDPMLIEGEVIQALENLIQDVHEQYLQDAKLTSECPVMFLIESLIALVKHVVVWLSALFAHNQVAQGNEECIFNTSPLDLVRSVLNAIFHSGHCWNQHLHKYDDEGDNAILQAHHFEAQIQPFTSFSKVQVGNALTLLDNLPQDDPQVVLQKLQAIQARALEGVT